MIVEAAVIGSPVSHSLSPSIFAFLGGKLDNEGLRYSAVDVPAEKLAEFAQNARKRARFSGFNVTIPHKEAIFAHLDSIDVEARAIGAVNTVRASAGGLEGFNTDVIGARMSIEESLAPVARGSVVIFGAGGSARAVAYALGQLEAEQVFVVGRSAERVRALIAAVQPHFKKTKFVAAGPGRTPVALVVNSTPAGMKGIVSDPETFAPLESMQFVPGTAAFDLIYNPEKTEFLALAQRLGLPILNGLSMLVDQAIASYQIWFGRAEVPDSLRSELLAYLRELLAHRTAIASKPIFLTGLMGSGKSTVGMTLAKELGWKFVDTDQLVIEAAGMSIPRIFETQGEPAFRRYEKIAIERACSMARAVISLGGGALVDPENLKHIESQGVLIYLAASIEKIQERLKQTSVNRPLIAGLGPEEQAEKLRSLLAARESTYQRAQLTVMTDDLSMSEISGKIRRELCR